MKSIWKLAWQWNFVLNWAKLLQKFMKCLRLLMDLTCMSQISGFFIFFIEVLTGSRIVERKARDERYREKRDMRTFEQIITVVTIRVGFQLRLQLQSLLATPLSSLSLLWCAGYILGQCLPSSCQCVIMFSPSYIKTKLNASSSVEHTGTR